MKITLANGTELNPILVSGGRRTVYGQNRDSLSFVFPVTEGIEALDAVFTAENCESITIEDDKGSYIHKGYTVRVELSKNNVEVTPATTETEAVREDRITVIMAQRTYMENQIASLTDTVDMLVMESLMG